MYFAQIYCIKYIFAVLFTEKYSGYAPEIYHNDTSIISHSFLLKLDDIQVLLEMTENVFLCNLNVLEDEFHFVLQCTKYNDLRKKYIKKYYWHRPSTFKLVQLLSVKNRKELCNLGKSRNESGRFSALKSDSTHLYQVRVITVFTVFRLLIDLSVYIIMSFDFPFVRLFGVR